MSGATDRTTREMRSSRCARGGAAALVFPASVLLAVVPLAAGGCQGPAESAAPPPTPPLEARLPTAPVAIPSPGPPQPAAAGGVPALADAPKETVARTEAIPAASTAVADVFRVKDSEWPMWGGTPARNMVNARERGIPSTWDVKTGKNVKWVSRLGSQSNGNPVVAGGKVFVGTNNELERSSNVKGDKGVVMCFRASDGKFLWQAVHDKLESGRVNDRPGDGVCSSPCADGDRLYYVSNRAELVCADVEGFLDGENDGPFKDEEYRGPSDADFIWVLDMMEELGVFPHERSPCSPLVVNDLVYVVTSNGVAADHVTVPSPRAPSIIAVDKMTGKVVWERNDPGRGILHTQWSSPSYFVAAGHPQVVFPGGDGWVRAYEPRSGSPLWQFDCNPGDAVHERGGRGTRSEIIATAVCVDDHVFVGVGQEPELAEGIGHLYSIDATMDGDVTRSGRAWHLGEADFRRTISTCAVKDGLVYAVDLRGLLQCIDQETGKPCWAHDMKSAVRGSPSWIAGRIYLGDEDGDVAVLDAGKELKVIAENNMDSSVDSTPVASDGVLYIANRTHLFAIAEAP